MDETPLSTHAAAPLADILRRYEDKCVVVSGATGYLGSALVALLSRVRCRLVLIARHADEARVPCGLAATTFVEGDVAARDTWAGAVDGVDCVFHFAAHEHRRGAPRNPVLDLEVNALGVIHLLECVERASPSARVVLASSANVCGIPATVPVDETAPPAPLTVYAIHKLAAERYLEVYAREGRVSGVALRLPNVYGPVPDRNVADRVVVNTLVKRGLAGAPLTVFRNGDCLRDYVFVDDVLTAFLLSGTCLTLRGGEAFMIGGGRGYRIAEAITLIADRIEARTGVRPRVEHDLEAELEPAEWRNFVADSRRFSGAAGWRAGVGLIEGLDRTIDYYLQGDTTGCQKRFA